MAVLGLVALYIHWLLPADFISGTHPYWSAQDEDITQYISGFNAFFHEPWHWPWSRIQSLNWPAGTLVTFVDSIPIYAGLLKALIPLSWYPFNPYGYWIALSLVLQGMAGWWILCEAQVRNWVVLLGLTILLITFPSLLNRIVHISLFSQWLILFAFALLLRGIRIHTVPQLAWTGLIGIALLINIYLFAMVCFIFMGAWLSQRHTYRSSIAWCQPLISVMCVVLVIALLTMWPLPAATGNTEFGFGVYSLNLLAPFSGGQLLNLTPDAFSAEQHFEGFNYLGAGIFLLLTCAWYLLIFSASKSMTPQTIWPRSIWFLFFALTCYAVSNRIYWGDVLLYTWNVPSWVMWISGQFRASGRFFWPVAYGLTLFAVISLARSLPHKRLTLLMSVACLLQVFDVWPIIMEFRQKMITPHAQIISYPQLQQALPVNTQNMYFYPKLKCAQHSNFLNTLLPMMRFASEHSLNFNTGYIARYNPACQQEAIEIAASNPANSVYLFVNRDYTQTSIQQFFPKQWQAVCQPIDFMTLCIIPPSIDLPKVSTQHQP